MTSAVKDGMTTVATEVATDVATKVLTETAHSVPALTAIDVRTLRLYVGDDERALQDFLGRFSARLAGDMDDLRCMIGAQRWKDAARLAHQMRSSALAIGAADFALLCMRLEHSALAPSSDAAQAALAALAGLGELENSFIAVQKAVMEVKHVGQ